MRMRILAATKIAEHLCTAMRSEESAVLAEKATGWLGEEVVYQGDGFFAVGGKTLPIDDLLAKIAKVLKKEEGEELARMAREKLAMKVSYIGDSMFEVED